MEDDFGLKAKEHIYRNRLDSCKEFLLFLKSNLHCVLPYARPNKDSLFSPLHIDKVEDESFTENIIKILLHDNSIPFDKDYIGYICILYGCRLSFNIKNHFSDLGTLIEDRDSYLSHIPYASCNYSFYHDLGGFSMYLLAYYYYHQKRLDEYHDLLDQFCKKYKDICEWCLMNDGIDRYIISYIKEDLYDSIRISLMNGKHKKGIK